MALTRGTTRAFRAWAALTAETAVLAAARSTASSIPPLWTSRHPRECHNAGPSRAGRRGIAESVSTGEGGCIAVAAGQRATNVRHRRIHKRTGSDTEILANAEATRRECLLRTIVARQDAETVRNPWHLGHLIQNDRRCSRAFSTM